MAALLKMSGAWEIQMGSWWKWYVSNDILVLMIYDTVSANVMIWVLQMGESESGQMVSEKVKWA